MQRSPLALAASFGHVDVVQFVLERGAVVDSLDADEQTPLQIAAAFGHLRVVEMLLDAGASAVRASDVSGRSAIHWAAQSGNAAIVKLILRRIPQATLNATERNGRTALDAAVFSQAYDCVRLLIAAGAAIGDAVSTADLVACIREEVVLTGQEYFVDPRTVPMLTLDDAEMQRELGVSRLQIAAAESDLRQARNELLSPL
jgi:hypothetical protein